MEEQKKKWPFFIQLVPIAFAILIYNIPNENVAAWVDDMIWSGFIFGIPSVSAAVGITGLQYAIRRKSTLFRVATIIWSSINAVFGILALLFAWILMHTSQ